MALSARTQSYLGQLGLLTLVDPSGGPESPHGTVAFKLVPAHGWHNDDKFPHEVYQDLKNQKFPVTSIEGLDYFLVPDETSNTPGTISHYALRTGRNDLNPVTHVQQKKFHQVKSAEAVKRYVKEK